MGKKLATVAAAALTEPGFESKAGYCQRFTRQCVQKAYGHKYDKYFKSSAYETMLAFRGTPYEVPMSEGTQVGDILYKGRKTSGKYGHVGIRILGNKVAENSSSHVSNTDREARGTRSLDAFAPYEMIVRLPD